VSLTNRYETVQIKYTGGSLAYECKETYWQYSWGWELRETKTDPSGAALTTTFDYYTDSTAPAYYRRAKSVTYPDGFWEVRQYCDVFDDYLTPYGALQYVLSPWMDTPSTPGSADPATCLVSRYEYGNPGHYEAEDAVATFIRAMALTVLPRPTTSS